MMWFLQKKECVEWRIINQNRALTLAKKRRFRIGGDPSRTKHEKDLHCTPAMHARFTSLFGADKIGHSSSVAASSPDVLQQIQILQQLVMGRLFTSWRDRSSHSQWNFSLPVTRPLRIIAFPEASYRNNEDGSSRRGMTVFLAESRERSSKDGMSYGSLIDYESPKVQTDCTLNNRGRIVFFRKIFWFMPVPREYGWTYLVKLQTFTWDSRKEPGNNSKNKKNNSFTWTDATIQIISILRNEDSSGSIHDLAHILTQNILADCSTKSSVRADNLITAVKTERLFDVWHSSQISEHSWSTRPSCLHGVEHFCNQVRRMFSWILWRSRDGPLHVMFCEGSMYYWAAGTRTYVREITSALADARICSSWTMVSS